MPTCCTGINDSHTMLCERTWPKPRLTCWCCGATFPVAWAALWSDSGSRCFLCEEHKLPCRSLVDKTLEIVYTLLDIRRQRRELDELIQQTLEHQVRGE